MVSHSDHVALVSSAYWFLQILGMLYSQQSKDKYSLGMKLRSLYIVYKNY